MRNRRRGRERRRGGRNGRQGQGQGRGGRMRTRRTLDRCIPGIRVQGPLYFSF